MPRVKRGTMVHKRHKKVIDAAAGYWGGKHRLYKSAHEQIMKSGNYAYTDRRNKKRLIRALWITRINAGCRALGVQYCRFMEGITKSGIALDRKVIAEMAVSDPDSFAKLVAQATSVLNPSGGAATA